MKSAQYKYDAFVSHAVEDKLAVANELCERLENAGLRIWYSGRELRLGDSLEEAIERGLHQSRYGIVILSQMYVQKNWPRKEYYMLKAMEAQRGKVILPVLYNISVEELHKLDINVADRWAISMDRGMDVVIEKLLEVIHENATVAQEKSARLKLFLRNKLAVLAASLIALLSLYLGFSAYSKTTAPSYEVVQHNVQRHVEEEEARIKKEHDNRITELQALPSGLAEIDSVFLDFSSIKSNYRNEYELEHDRKVIRSRKKVEAALKLDLESLNHQNAYKLVSPDIFLATKRKNNVTNDARYLLLNTQPVTYEVVDEQQLDNGDYAVTVSYNNNVRQLSVNLLFPGDGSPLKRHQMCIMGFPPVEKFIFHKDSGNWLLSSIE